MSDQLRMSHKEYELQQEIENLTFRLKSSELECQWLRKERRDMLDDLGKINGLVNTMRCDYESNQIPF